MYKLCLILIFLCIAFSLNVVEAVTMLNGGVSYTVSEARTIAFDGITLEIPIESFKEHFIDKNKINFGYKKTSFSDGTYALHNRKLDICYYYSSNRTLKFIEKKVPIQNMKKYARYNINGQLDSVALDIDNNEQFIFDTNKKLVAHWIGKNCYNEKGELIKTRD